MVFLTRIVRQTVKMPESYEWILKLFNNPTFHKWYFNLHGYNKWGMYHDDMFLYQDHEVHEALRRMPRETYDQHCYRVVRCIQLDLTKTYMPVNERPTWEDDIDETKGRFLHPYLREIYAEKKEKEDWEKFLMQ